MQVSFDFSAVFFITNNTSKNGVTSLTCELQIYVTYKNVHGMVRSGSEQSGRHHKGHRLRLLHSYVLLWGCYYGAFHLWTLHSISIAFFLNFLAAICGRDGTGTSYRCKWYTSDQVYYFILKEIEIIFVSEKNITLPEEEYIITPNLGT